MASKTKTTLRIETRLLKWLRATAARNRRTVTAELELILEAAKNG